MTPSFAISGLLFLTLVFAFPIWDVIEAGRLRAASDSNARGLYYWRVMSVEWSLTLLVVALLGWRATLFFDLPVRPSWLPPQDTLVGFLVAFLASLFIPIILSRRSGGAGSFFARELTAIDYLLPKMQSQRASRSAASILSYSCCSVYSRSASSALRRASV